MFLGEYEYKVDIKGRLPLPPKFRQEFGAELVLTRGEESCIVAYPTSEWLKVTESIAAKQMIPSKRRKVHRVKYGSANSLTLDAQGRIALPSTLRAYAQIGNDAIIVGASNYIEIWNPSLWSNEKVSSEEEVYQIIENLEGQQ
jgi:MraZ protein